MLLGLRSLSLQNVRDPSFIARKSEMQKRIKIVIATSEKWKCGNLVQNGFLDRGSGSEKL
jgi:hypothetical protein